MADNGRAHSLSPTSDNDSSDHSPMSFTTLSGGSSVTRGYMISSLSNNSTTTTSNNNRLVPTPPPPSSAPGGGYSVLPGEPKEDLTTPSSKRPRGRPPGSKNKPKPPILIREDTESLMKPIIIEIPAGNDIIESIISFARRRQVGISVLSGSGSISDVTLRHPVSRAPAFPIQGPFNMLSLTGTYVNACGGRVPPRIASNPASFSFAIYLSGSRGQVFGGVVGGKVVAAGLVVVTATLFKKPEFYRVALINGRLEELEEDDAVYPNGVIMNADHHHPHAAAGGGDQPNGIANNNNNSNSNTAAVIAIPNMPAFAVANGNSAPLNRQLPPPPPPPGVADVNVMQWNHSTHRPDNY